MKLAISEACTNAVKAHESAEDSRPVGLVIEPVNSHLEFAVVDRGGGFDVVQITRRPIAASDLVEGGIGLQIIRSLFPQAVVEPNDHGGTTVRFAVDVGA